MYKRQIYGYFIMDRIFFSCFFSGCIYLFLLNISDNFLVVKKGAKCLELFVITQNIKRHISVKETFACKKREMQIRVATRRFRHRDAQRNTVRVTDMHFSMQRGILIWRRKNAERSRNRPYYHQKQMDNSRKKDYIRMICWCFTKFNFYQGKILKSKMNIQSIRQNLCL